MTFGSNQLLFGIRWLAIGVLAMTAASGQTVLSDPKKIADAENLLDTLSGSQLQCDVTPIRPHFIFSLRLQAGYHADMPLSQSEGQQWIALTKITPKANGNSVYLSDVIQSPSEGDSGHAKIEGYYWLGEGSYSVKFLMFDNRADVCRKEWQIDARLNSGVHNFKPVLAPGTVEGISSSSGVRAAGAKPVGRLTILLHAASVLQMQTLLGPLDKAMLLDGMAALMEEMPARSVRLVMFNLEQQREILRKDDFTIEALPEVAHALNAVQPATVNYSDVQNAGGALDLIEDLVNQEIRASEPSGAVVFIGPRSIYKNKPSAAFDLPAGAKQQLFYLICEPTGILRPSSIPAPGWSAQGPEMRQGPGMNLPLPFPGGDPVQPNFPSGRSSNYGPNHGPDIIEYAVDKLRGKTMTVDSVESFANAVAEIARRAGTSR